jgi:hypothetical protein
MEWPAFIVAVHVSYKQASIWLDNNLLKLNEIIYNELFFIINCFSQKKFVISQISSEWYYSLPW